MEGPKTARAEASPSGPAPLAGDPGYGIGGFAGCPAPSRREFLAASAAALHWPWTLRAATGASELGFAPTGSPSRVVTVRAREVVRDKALHLGLLREMLRDGLTKLTGGSTEAGAWAKLLSPQDVVGLKFNRSGQRMIGTTPAVGGTLITSLLESGWSAGQIVCIEAPGEVEQRFKTVPARPGYGREVVSFGSGSDQFAEVLDQVTALIDVPFLKTHNIAGFTCALKNLSHGLVRHPARFHGNGCSPYIADIVAVPRIRTKLRLCVVDALRVVFEDGPVPRPETVAAWGSLIVGVDPVAVDAVGLDLLNEVRGYAGAGPVATRAVDVGYLREAQARKLGVANPHEIERIHHDLTG